MHKIHSQIGLLNHIGGGNLGDDATIGAVLQNIRQRWPDVAITAFSQNPSDTSMRHGIAKRRSEEHTSELQSLTNLVCRLLLEKKKTTSYRERSIASESGWRSITARQ